jgi:hypothetical protein
VSRNILNVSLIVAPCDAACSSASLPPAAVSRAVSGERHVNHLVCDVGALEEQIAAQRSYVDSLSSSHARH